MLWKKNDIRKDERRAKRQADIEAIGEAERRSHECEKLNLKVILNLSETIEDLNDSIKELTKTLTVSENRVVKETHENHENGFKSYYRI